MDNHSIWRDVKLWPYSWEARIQAIESHWHLSLSVCVSVQLDRYLLRLSLCIMSVASLKQNSCWTNYKAPVHQVHFSPQIGNMSTGLCIFWARLWFHFYWISYSLQMGHLNLETIPVHGFSFDTFLMSLVIERGHVKYFKYWIGMSFYADVQCWIWSKNSVWNKKKKALSEKTMLFIVGPDTYLFNLNLQMLIDHGSFQSVQMLWSLNWNKHTILISMQTSCICFLQISITFLALFSGNVYQINIWWTTCNHRNNWKCELLYSKWLLSCIQVFSVYLQCIL